MNSNFSISNTYLLYYKPRVLLHQMIRVTDLWIMFSAISFVLILTSISATPMPENILTKMEILKRLSNEHFHTRHVIFLGEDSDLSHISLARTKWLSSFGIASAVLPINSENKASGFFNLDHFPAILVAMDSSVFSRMPLLALRVSNKYILYSDKENDPVLDTLQISYDTKFVLAKNSGNYYSLTELYKIKNSGPTLRLDLGYFLPERHVLSILSQNLFNRRSNFQGTELAYLITTFNPCENLSLETWNAFLCVQLSIWNTIVEKLNATARPTLSTSREPAYLVKKFEEGVAQVSVNGWSITSLSIVYISFLWPTFLSQLDAFSKVQGMEIGWSRYLMPFSASTWKVVFGWIILSSGAIFIYRSTLIFAARQYKTFPGKSANECRDEQIWTPTYAFFAQGTSAPATTIRERLLVLMAFLVPAVLVPAYSAALTSFLAIQLPNMPLKDIHNFLDHREYTLGGVRTISLRQFFQGNDELTNHLRNAIVDGDAAPINDSVAVRWMCSGKFTFISTEVYLVEQNPACEYYKMRKPITTFYQSLTLPKNSPYKSVFNIVLRNIAYSGVLETLKRKTFLTGTFALLKSHKEPTLQAVTMEEVAVLLVSLAMATLLSLIILFWERLKFHKQNVSSIQKVYPFYH